MHHISSSRLEHITFPRPTGPKTAGAASRACNKTANCGNPGFVRNIMQEQYPELEVYQCEGGKLRRYADYWAAV